MHSYILRIIILSLVALNASAASFKLVGSQSELRYEVIKFKSTIVEGELASESKNTLTGNLTVKNIENATDLTGTIVLSDPFFKSGSYQRDIKLKEIIHGPIKIEIEQVTKYVQARNEMELTIKLFINGVSGTETTTATLTEIDGLLDAKGTLDINREKYGLIFKDGFIGQLDLAIAESFLLTYDLKFEPKGYPPSSLP